LATPHNMLSTWYSIRSPWTFNCIRPLPSFAQSSAQTRGVFSETTVLVYCSREAMWLYAYWQPSSNYCNYYYLQLLLRVWHQVTNTCLLGFSACFPSILTILHFRMTVVLTISMIIATFIFHVQPQGRHASQ